MQSRHDGLLGFRYSTILPDLDFAPAVVLLTRVISRPEQNRLCLDLGHKAVASENPHPRVKVFGLEDATPVGHSEEHLVLETDRAADFPVGSPLYGMPWHVCPTVALHNEAVVIRNGRAEERWQSWPAPGRSLSESSRAWGLGIGSSAVISGGGADPPQPGLIHKSFLAEC